MIKYILIFLISGCYSHNQYFTDNVTIFNIKDTYTDTVQLNDYLYNLINCTVQLNVLFCNYISGIIPKLVLLSTSSNSSLFNITANNINYKSETNSKDGEMVVSQLYLIIVFVLIIFTMFSIFSACILVCKFFERIVYYTKSYYQNLCTRRSYQTIINYQDL